MRGRVELKIGKRIPDGIVKADGNLYYIPGIGIVRRRVENATTLDVVCMDPGYPRECVNDARWAGLRKIETSSLFVRVRKVADKLNRYEERTESL